MKQWRDFRAWSALALGMVASASHATASLVSYYNFDGSDNNDQVGSNHGQVNNQTGYSASTPDGSSASLDLSSPLDYVRVGPASPNGPDFGIASTNNATISMWVNYTASARGIVTVRQDLTSGGGDRSGITFGIGGDNRPFFGLIVSSGANDAANGGATFRDITTDQLVPLNTWTHMAATYDSTSDTLAIYVNGVAANTYSGAPAGSFGADGSNLTGGVGVIDFVDPNGSFTGFGAAGNGPPASGSAGDFTRLYYDGLLDDVAIWNQALSAGNIERLANGVSPLDIPEPTAPLMVLLAAGLAGLRRRR